MEQLNWSFVILDIFVGVAVFIRALHYRNWGVLGIALIYLFLRVPYSLGHQDIEHHFIFWRAYELTVLAIIWFEMGKRRSV